MIAKTVVDMYDKGVIDKVVLISTAFVNNLEQKVKSLQLLPFKMQDKEDFTTHDAQVFDTRERQVEYEPSIDEVFNYLIPKYVEIMLYSSVIESCYMRTCCAAYGDGKRNRQRARYAFKAFAILQ